MFCRNAYRSLPVLFLLSVLINVVIGPTSSSENQGEQSREVPFDENRFRQEKLKLCCSDGGNSSLVEEDVDLIWECNCTEKCCCLDRAEENVQRMEDELNGLSNRSCCETDDVEPDDPYTFRSPLADITRDFWNSKTAKTNETEDSRAGETGTGSKSKESKCQNQKISMDNILKDISKRCCNDQCLKKLSLQSVSEQRKRVWSKPHSECKVYINAMIEQAELGRNPRKGGKGPSEKRFTFNAVDICPIAWCAVQGISKTCFFESRKALSDDLEFDTTTKLSRRSVTHEIAKLWFAKPFYEVLYLRPTKGQVAEFKDNGRPKAAVHIDAKSSYNTTN
ncbi:Hypothetical predicted protein, partial [Paramuricea clavata]